MIKYIITFFFLFFITNGNTSNKEKIIENLKNTQNLDFNFEQNINGEIESKLVSLLNSFLNHSISIKKIMKVIDNAHARFDAISRTYKYKISFCKDPFRHERYFELRNEINFKNI